MDIARKLIRNHPAIAALLVAAAIALRLLVPTGFMPVVADHRFVVTICSGTMDGPVGSAMVMPGMAPDHDRPALPAGKCAYADLAQSVTGGFDPVLPAATAAFVLTPAPLMVATAPRFVFARARPPARAPPAVA